MESNEDKFDKNKLLEDYEDGLWRVVMYDYAETEGKKLLEENEALKSDPQYQPSPDALKKYYKMLDDSLRRNKFRSFKRIASKFASKAAFFIVILAVIGAVTFTTVSAFRVEVLNFLLGFEKKYTSIKLDSDSSGNIIGENIYVNWHDAYAPTYIPEGYAITSLTNTNDFKAIDYMNDANDFITFFELSASVDNAVDTENASSVQTITINGYEGLLVVKDGKTIIAWSDNIKIFSLHTQLDVDETIKIAESVTFIK